MTEHELRVLIITGQDHFHHRWRESSAHLRAVLERGDRRFDVRITEEFTGASAATLEPYDVVILNYFGAGAPGDQEARWGTSAESALFSHVDRGKGLVMYHGSIWCGRTWQDAHADRLWRMAAGLHQPGGSRRAPGLNHEVSLADPDHPITNGLPRQWQQVNDDKYVNLRWHPDAQPHILATVDDNPKDYLGGAYYAIDAEPGPALHDPAEVAKLPGVGQRHPVAWTNDFGAGRVFVLALGHIGAATVEAAHEGRLLGRPVGPTLSDAARTAPFLNLLRRGTEWAGTGRVTLPLIQSDQSPTAD